MPLTHQVSFLNFQEFTNEFGFSSQVRRRLVEQIEEARHSLYKNGAVRIYVGGSFIEPKPNPNDLDLLVLLADSFNSVALGRLKEALKRSRIDIIFCFNVQMLSTWLSFLGHNRQGYPTRVIELVDLPLPIDPLLSDPGYFSDAIYAFKLSQSQELLQATNDPVDKKALEQYIAGLTKEYERNSILFFYKQCLAVEVTMPGNKGESDIQTNSLIGTFFLEDEEFSLVDFGCGQGRLISVLASLDESILKYLSYIGVDFDTSKAQQFSVEKKFDALCKSVEFTTFDDFYKSNLRADYIISINVIHEVSAEHFYDAVYLPVFRLNPDGCFLIYDMEQLPLGEAGFAPWNGKLLKAFFQELGLFPTLRRHPSKGGTPLFSLVIKAVSTPPLNKPDFNAILLRYYHQLLQHYQQQRKTKDISERLYGYYSVVIANICDNIVTHNDPSL